MRKIILSKINFPLTESRRENQHIVCKRNAKSERDALPLLYLGEGDFVDMMLDLDFNFDIDLSTRKPNRQPEISRKVMLKYERILTQSVRDLADIVKFDLTEGTQYRIVTTKSINALTAVKAMLSEYQPTEIIMAIYRMNQPAVATICDISENSDIPVAVLVSSFFRENKKYENWTRMLETAGKRIANLTVGFAWSHAKVTLIKTACGKHIVFEGSGNLSDNARIEQYMMENNKQAYEFHKAWIMEAMSEYKQA